MDDVSILDGLFVSQIISVWTKVIVKLDKKCTTD